MAHQPDGKDEATGEKDGPTGGSERTFSRRSLLRVGTAAAALGTVGATEALAAGETVDIVDAGADPTGGEPVDGVLESVVGDDVVVEFPSDGTFRIAGADLNADRFELRGNGATLLPDGGLLSVSGYGWTVDGFEIDQREYPGYGRLSVSGGNYEVSRCIWRGQAGSAEDWAVFVRADSGTTARFVDCYWPDGAVDGGEQSSFGCIGTFQDYTSGATLTFERCWFHGWSEDTIYASKPSVDIRIIDSYFTNTIVGPRVSDVTMRGCTCVHDGPIPVEGWSGSSFQAGLWLNGEKGTYGEPLIEDCDLYIVGPDGTHPIKGGTLPGPLTVRDTRIHNETGKAAIWADGAPSEFHNVTISGDNTAVAADQAQVEDVTVVSGEAADPAPPIPTPPPEGSIPGGSDETSDTSGSDTSGSDTDDTSDGSDDTSDDGDQEWRRLRVEGDGDPTTGAEFAFEVTGDLESLTAEEGVRQEGHGVDGSYVREDAWSGHEEYRFTGEIRRFDLAGPATVFVDGEETPVPEVPDWHEIRIEGDGDPTTGAEFALEVTGELESLTPEEGVRQDDHGVDGSYVREDAWSGSEEYRFTGTVDHFDLVGPATVFVDGEETPVSEVA